MFRFSPIETNVAAAGSSRYIQSAPCSPKGFGKDGFPKRGKELFVVRRAPVQSLFQSTTTAAGRFACGRRPKTVGIDSNSAIRRPSTSR